MKISHFLAIGGVVVIGCTCLAQGPLLPPDGPPAPTMKSLDQVEARTIIASAPFTIETSGSYYLTRNLTVTAGDAVTISADNVTLDLNGFTISSTAAVPEGTGVYLAGGRRNVAVRNGHITGGIVYDGAAFTGPGFVSGIDCQPGVDEPVNCRVSHISVSGCRAFGIKLSITAPHLIESCQVSTVGTGGIVASTVVNCRVQTAGTNGIAADMVSHSQASSIAGSGIYAFSLADHCSGSSMQAAGITVQEGTASHCLGISQGSGDGISGMIVTDSRGKSSGGRGILALTATNCHGSSSSNRGISSDIVTSCIGSTAGSSFGINAARIAQSSHGSTMMGTGLSAHIVNSCTGSAGNISGTALSAAFKYNTP